jgi:hypothetical protein
MLRSTSDLQNKPENFMHAFRFIGGSSNQTHVLLGFSGARSGNNICRKH